ncbi:hypothetical protein D9M68_831970 [compost metagenome]
MQALGLQFFLPEGGGLLRGQLLAVLAALPPFLAAAEDEVRPGRGMGAAEQQHAAGPEAGAGVLERAAGRVEGVEFAVEDNQVALRDGGVAFFAYAFGAGVGIAFRLLVADVVQHVGVGRRVAVVGHVEVERVAAIEVE